MRKFSTIEWVRRTTRDKAAPTSSQKLWSTWENLQVDSTSRMQALLAMARLRGGVLWHLNSTSEDSLTQVWLLQNRTGICKIDELDEIWLVHCITHSTHRNNTHRISIIITLSETPYFSIEKSPGASRMHTIPASSNKSSACWWKSPAMSTSE